MASLFFRKNRDVIRKIIDLKGDLPTVEDVFLYLRQEKTIKRTLKRDFSEAYNNLKQKDLKRIKSKPVARTTTKKSENRITIDMLFFNNNSAPLARRDSTSPPRKIQIFDMNENKSLMISEKDKITCDQETSRSDLSESRRDVVILTDHKRNPEQNISQQTKHLENILDGKIATSVLTQEDIPRYTVALPKRDVENIETINKPVDSISEHIRSSFGTLRRVRDINVLLNVDLYSIEDTADSFRSLFLSRYNKIKKVLLNQNMINADVDFVVMVREIKSQSTYGIIIGEYVREPDEIHEGMFIVDFRQQNGMLRDKFMHIIPDIVIGMKVKKLSNNRYRVLDIVFPEISRIRQKRRADEDVYVLLLSDIHLGSKKFLYDCFERFLNFTNGSVSGKQLRELSERIGYILILGDVVDGVGVYPDQKNELEITNIYQQYEKIAEFFELIPQDIRIIIIPGNHDAAGNLLPQPPIPKEIAEPLYQLKNVTLLSNPSMIEIENVRILMYHGYGLERVASQLHMGITKPTRIISELLRYRHLIPMWGAVPMAPLKEDYFVIDTIPDIIAMGHIHIFDARNAKGNILTIVPGSFQDITSWQIKLGIQPTPGLFGIVNLRTFELKTIDFSRKEIELY